MNKSFAAKLRILAGIGLFAAASQIASAGVITFDGQAVGAMAANSSFTEAGFTITATINPSDHPTDQATIVDLGSGNHAVGDGDISDFFGTLLDITLTGGGTFDVTSLDAANLGSSGGFSSGCGNGDRIDVSSSAGCFSIFPGSSTFSTIAVSFIGITDLQLNFVSFSGSNFVVDNIVASASAPEPSSLLLGFASLVGFAARRRFRRA